MGDYEKAHAVIERMLGRYVGSSARSHVVRYQFNQRFSARAVRGRILWVRGRPDSALRDIEENVSEAIALGHTMSLCNVLAQAACPVALLVGELDTAQHYLDVLIDRTGARALDVWRTYALCFGAALDIERGDPEGGLDRLHVAAEWLHRSGFGHNRTSFLLMRAVGLLRLNRATDADAAIDEAMTICERTGEGWGLPELHRMRGEIALNRRESEDIEAAVEAFEQALRLAREQKALAWELRAATSLVRCLEGDTRMDAARTLLRGIYAQFSEGHDRRDLRVAAALLEPPSQANKSS